MLCRFQKSINTVWRNGLFFKLLNSGVSPGFVKLLKSMYSQINTCIQLPQGISETFRSLVGLKQGCNLSPLLFNLYINDFVDRLNVAHSDAPLLNNLQVSCLLYADDLVLRSETQNGLQVSLNTLHRFTQDWFLEVNPKKTKCLTFSKGKCKKDTTFNLGDVTLDQCDSYCYLGVIFSRSGSMNMASKALHDKALGAMFSLIRNINKHHACNFDLMLDLFDKMVVPIALYNSEVWGTNFLSANTKNNDFFLM